MSVSEFLWLILIFAGITVALYVLWAETMTAWYEWRTDREDEQ